MFGPPLPTLSDPFSSLTVLAPAIGSDGFTDAPSGGASAAAGSYSAALLGLNVKVEATSCVAAAFSAVTSPRPDASGSAGPLTVVRLLRTVLWSLEAFEDLDSLEPFDGREDFAIKDSPLRLRGLMISSGGSCAGFHHHLDARVVFVAERAIHRRRVFQPDAMRDDERRIDLAALDALEQDR